jgi:hypothetical protein
MTRRRTNNPDNGLKGWVWTAQRQKAAVLVAENNLSHARIAEEIPVSSSTLAAWKNTEAFMVRVRELEAEMDAAIMRLPIARKAKRVEGYQKLKDRLQLIVEDREQVYSQDEDVVGGRSGFVVKQTKSVGYGKQSQIVTENAFDAALFRELRAIDEQAAKELGQWVDKGEISGPSGGPIVISDLVVDRSSVGGKDMSDDIDDIDD